MRTRYVRWLASLVLLSAVATASADDGREAVQKALSARFKPSQIETQSGRRGAVVRTGRLLILSLDGIPAKPFRVMRATPSSPLVHVMEFARVEIASDGRVITEAAALRLNRGARLVVLDMKLVGSRVHLLMHTADPVEVPRGGEPVYGCTEFVFEFAPELIQAGRVETIVERIEGWLEWTPEERVCRPDIDLCMEP